MPRSGPSIPTQITASTIFIIVGILVPSEAYPVRWAALAIGIGSLATTIFNVLIRGRDGLILRQVSMKKRRFKTSLIDIILSIFPFMLSLSILAWLVSLIIFLVTGVTSASTNLVDLIFTENLGNIFHGNFTEINVYGWIFLSLVLILSVFDPEHILWGLSQSFNKYGKIFRNWRSIGGVGGVANWANMLEEAKPEYDLDFSGIFLGASSYYPDRLRSLNDNRHFVTIAGTRGGKGRSVIIPTLLTYAGSVIVLDPKGENAAITARRRREMGQTVHILDPFGIVPGVETARFNPLAELELTSDRIREDIEAIADGIVVPESGSGFHFSESARIIIAGFMAYLVAREPPENRTLPAMLELMMDQRRREDALLDMATNPACGGLMMQAVNILGIAAQSGGEGFSAYMSTLTRNLSWIGSKPMAHVLSASDLSLAELKAKRTTIYLCLQEQDLVEHKRFLRVVLNLAINAIGTTLKSSPHGTLFLLDEFHVLGPMEKVKTAAALMAGYGLKLWIVLQSLSQLKEAAPDAWETIMDTAGAVQVFSLGLDQETALWASQAMGRYPVIRREDRPDHTGKVRRVEIAEGIADLASPGEVRALTERERMTQIVIRPGRDTLFLRRVNYDGLRLFRRWYDPRPGEGASRRGARYVPPARPKWAGTGWQDWVPFSQRGGSGGRRQEQRADPDPYKESLKMFGLKDGFTLDELKARYRELQKRVHPDLGGSDYFASLLNSAYEYLKPRARP